MNFASSNQNSWPRRFMNWTLGNASQPDAPFLVATPHQEPIDTENRSTPNAPRTRVEDEGTLPVWVEQNARPPLEAFKDAITDGTRLFCEQNVHPLYVLDPRTKFRLTGIQLYVPREKTSFLQILERLPIEVRNRMAKILVQGAPGASDQLVVDDGFFGITVDIEPSVIAGEPVRLIASWSRESAEVKLVFSGQYISVEPKPSNQPDPVLQAPAPVPAATVLNPPVAVRQTVPVAAPDDLDAQAPLQTPAPTEPSEPRPRSSKAETPLGLPVPAKRKGTDTPLGVFKPRHIAMIRYRYADQDQETTVGITADMLPFMIGREHTSTGRFAHGLSLEDNQDTNRTLLVSREHLEINRFNANDATFYFINHAHTKNGTHHKGSVLSERFMMPIGKAQEPAVFQLGGCGGAGTVQITIEAVGHGN